MIDMTSRPHGGQVRSLKFDDLARDFLRFQSLVVTQIAITFTFFTLKMSTLGFFQDIYLKFCTYIHLVGFYDLNVELLKLPKVVV